jgi:DNA polymerase V
MSYIGLVDCNNFFVSCERLFRPDLRKKPTLVLSSNDGCVVARSQEVKDLGIPMGAPYFKIKDLVKEHQIAIFSGNFALYRDISSRVMQVLKEEVGNVEQYSIDEAFFELSQHTPNLLESLHNIRQAIETQVGVPVSLGLSRTKTIAKFASEKEKKHSRACVLLGEEWQILTTTIAVSEIWGIGRQTTAKLNQLGINTVADLLKADRARIDKIFGINGLRLLSELSQQPVYDLFEAPALQHSIMSTRSFSRTVTDLKELKQAVNIHVESVCEDLREMKAVAKEIRVMILPSRHGDYLLRGGVLSVSLDEGSSDTRVVLKEAYKLLERIYESGVPYKKAGVIVGSIEEVVVKQGSLFTKENPDDPALMSLIDQVNQRFGRSHLMIGRINQKYTWQAQTEHLSPNYTTKWSDLKSVRA